MKFNQYDLNIFSAFCAVAEKSSTPDQVKISEIAKKLGVSRQSIYKSHYRNINEIINALHLYIEEDINRDFQNAIVTNKESFDCIYFIAYNILPKLFLKKEYLHVLYGTSVDPSWHNFLTKRYTHMLSHFFHTKNSKLDEEDYEFIVAQTLAIIGVWMRSDKPEEPIYFSKKFYFMLEHSIADILNNVDPYQQK